MSNPVGDPQVDAMMVLPFPLQTPPVGADADPPAGKSDATLVPAVDPPTTVLIHGVRGPKAVSKESFVSTVNVKLLLGGIS